MSIDNKIAFDKEEDFEKAFVALLTNCGWEKNVLTYPTEDELIKNWAEILFNNNREKDKLGDYPLTNGEMQQIIEQIKNQRTPFALNRFINGKTVSVKRDNPDDKLHLGKEVSLHIYDRLEIAGGKSRYQIVRQPKFSTTKNLFPARRGDVMLLINGMPVFHIELKKGGIPISKAWNQIEKYSQEGIFSGIFSLLQIFIAMTPDDAVYFANPGSEGRFDTKFYFHWANADNVPMTDWRVFTQNLLSIPMAHQMIGFYTVADGSDGILKVLRSYQYFAVSAITNRVAQNKWDDKKQRGGYIWHTTGSGKTLTSFKTADLIAKSQDADKVVFLVDRIELGTQSLGNYKDFADDEDDVQSTENTDVLITKLKSTNPADTLIVTSIQKMSRIIEDGTKKSQRDIELINKKRVVFIVDECHRDTFGDMMSNVKTTFPCALFFGFSGTPIQDENKKKGCTSSDVFGNELHRYTIGDGIRDGNVLAFDPYMICTYKDIDIKKQIALEMVHAKSEDEAIADPKKHDKYFEIISTITMAGYFLSDVKYVRGAEDYLPSSQYLTDEHTKTVVADILDRFKTVSHGGKFHAIFATSSIPEAINYYRLLKDSIKATVLVDPSDNNDKTNFYKLEGLAEIIDDYNKRYVTHYTIPLYGDMKKDISLRMSHEKAYKGIEKTPEKQVDLLIVVNQMLTGFDSKWVNTLYLDKVMRQESIIQAFSRTNRIFCGEGKPVGMIYYYRLPHTMRRNIEEAVKMYCGDKAYKVFVDKLEENVKKFNALFADIEELFINEKIPDFAHLPQDKTVCAKFAQLFKQLNTTLEMIKVQGFSWKKNKYGNTTVALTEEKYLILLQRYKELFGGGEGGGGEEEPPYDLDPHITEISTGKIDADYMNSRFDRYLKIKRSGDTQANIESALQALFKSFALLPESEQKFANIFIKDVQLGNIIPEEGKTFRDYISKYMRRAKDDQIHRFASCFGLNEALLREAIELHLSEDNINEFDRLGKIKDTADIQKVKAYFLKKSVEELSIFKIKVKFYSLLRDFILLGGFDI